MTDLTGTIASLTEKAAAAVVTSRGLTHEDAFRAFTRALIDELGVPDLLAAKIELLAEYKLDYPQDYAPDDVARMQAELTRLRSLQQMLAGPAD
jgi:hypothetical protein